MRGSEDAPRGPFYFLERRHGLADIVERGVGVFAKRLRVIPPQFERGVLTVSASHYE